MAPDLQPPRFFSPFPNSSRALPCDRQRGEGSRASRHVPYSMYVRIHDIRSIVFMYEISSFQAPAGDFRSAQPNPTYLFPQLILPYLTSCTLPPSVLPRTSVLVSGL